jgi:hypothetical protein
LSYCIRTNPPHNPKVTGSNPVPATKFIKKLQQFSTKAKSVDMQFLCSFLSVAGVNETGDRRWQTMTKRRNGDGSTSWDAMVRIVGYPPIGRSFRTKIQANLWAARTEAAAKGGTLSCARGMTLAHLIDEALPRLTKPTAAAFTYWREQLGDMRLAARRT